MAQPNVWAPVIAKLAQLGVAVAPELQAKLDKVVEPLLDQDANTVVTAIANHIDMHGVAGMMNGSLRDALTGSEPSIDAMLNANVDSGADALVDAFRRIAASAS